MKNYKAVITEKTSPMYGQTFATTKIGQYKGMSLSDFNKAVKFLTCFTYEIKEI